MRILKITWIIWSIIMLYSCGTIFLPKKHQITEIPQRDVLADVNSFVDSLQRNQTDSILIFQEGCWGCGLGVYKPIYIFWNKNGHSFVAKMDNNHTYYDPIAVTSAIIAFYYKHIHDITSENIISLYGQSSHYRYSHIKLIEKGKLIYSIEVSDFDRGGKNLDTAILRWIFHIESELFSLERLCNKWEYAK